MKLTNCIVTKTPHKVFTPVTWRPRSVTGIFDGSASVWRKTKLVVNNLVPTRNLPSLYSGHYQTAFITYYTCAQFYETNPELSFISNVFWLNYINVVTSRWCNFRTVFLLFFNTYKTSNHTSWSYFNTKQPSKVIASWAASQVKYL